MTGFKIADDSHAHANSPPAPSVSGAGVVGQHNQTLQTCQWNLDRGAQLM